MKWDFKQQRNISSVFYHFLIVLGAFLRNFKVVTQLNLEHVSKNLKFFSLKFNMVCMFWIVLMCWCQKLFLKNKKTSFTCILARKVIWKTPATILSNTPLVSQLNFSQFSKNWNFSIKLLFWDSIRS